MKTKSELLKEMQLIAEEVQKTKDEIETLLQLIEKLELDYFKLAEEISKN